MLWVKNCLEMKFIEKKKKIKSLQNPIMWFAMSSLITPFTLRQRCCFLLSLQACLAWPHDLPFQLCLVLSVWFKIVTWVSLFFSSLFKLLSFIDMFTHYQVFNWDKDTTIFHSLSYLYFYFLTVEFGVVLTYETKNCQMVLWSASICLSSIFPY